MGAVLPSQAKGVRDEFVHLLLFFVVMFSKRAVFKRVAAVRPELEELSVANKWCRAHTAAKKMGNGSLSMIFQRLRNIDLAVDCFVSWI